MKMKIIPEQIVLISAVILVASCLAAGGIWEITAVIVVLFGVTAVRGFLTPLPLRSLRSLAILLIIIFMPFYWSGAYWDGLVAVEKVIGLFLVSLLVFRGLGAAGVCRALTASGSRHTPSGVGQLMLLPFLLGRLDFEWRRARFALSFRSGTVRKVSDWLRGLRVVFWRSQSWPETLNVSYRLRLGSTETVLNREETASVGLREAGLFFIALASMVLVLVERRF